MSDQSSFISQIKEEEAKAAKMLEGVEAENNERLSKAAEEGEALVNKAENEEREKALELIQKAKDEAKNVYSKLMVDSDNARRDVIEGGKTRIEQGKNHVMTAFMEMFQ